MLKVHEEYRFQKPRSPRRSPSRQISQEVRQVLTCPVCAYRFPQRTSWATEWPEDVQGVHPSVAEDTLPSGEDRLGMKDNQAGHNVAAGALDTRTVDGEGVH